MNWKTDDQTKRRRAHLKLQTEFNVDDIVLFSDGLCDGQTHPTSFKRKKPHLPCKKKLKELMRALQFSSDLEHFSAVLTPLDWYF